MDPRSLRSTLALCRDKLTAASDGAKIFFICMLNSISLCSLYNIYKITAADFDPNHVAPHASVQKVSSAQQEQTTQFQDSNAGYSHDAVSPYDLTRSLGMPSDVPLDKFFERPLLVETISWTISGPTPNTRINPWDLFFNDPRIINRISNYSLMQANLHVKFVLNGNSFLYGRILCSYTPLIGFDSYTRFQNFDIDAVELSQRPRVFLDPCNSQGGTLSLPFLTPSQSMSIVGNEYVNLGSIDVVELVQLRHANGATDTVTIQVFAWATDVKLSNPTSFNPFTITPQADEYGTGPISRPASVIADIANKLTKVPLIAPFARATELGASVTSGIANIFGFSRPPMVESSMFRNMTKTSIANSNMQEDIQKLSLDIKQELTIDTRPDGASGKDEMDILTIAQTESYFTKFNWERIDIADTLLWNCVVTPLSYRTAGSGNTAEIHLTAPAFASLPFHWWRGTMRYRFQVVASKFHRGRLRFVYDPNGTSPTAPNFNTNYTTIVDISDTTDFVVECGWGQPRLWRTVGDLTNPSNLTESTSPLSYFAPSETHGNGTLSVYVVNDLTTPSDTTPQVELMVFVSVGDDFEVASPTGEFLSRLRFTNPGSTLGPSVNSVPIDPLLMIPQANFNAESFLPQMDAATETGTKLDSSPATPEEPDIIELGESLEPHDLSHKIHFGEVFRSFRPLLKRYMTTQLPTITVGFGTNILYFLNSQFWALPSSPGFVPAFYQDSPIGSEGVLQTSAFGTGAYRAGTLTHLTYFSSAFAGWKGGVRWLFDDGPMCCDDLAASSFTSRSAGCAAKYYAGGWAEIETSLSRNNKAIVGLKDHTGLEGSAIQNNVQQGVSSVEIPFYSNYRFCPARQYQSNLPSAGFEYMPCLKRTIVVRQRANATANKNFQLRYMVAAAEDFTPIFYIGPPTMYLELVPPTS